MFSDHAWYAFVLGTKDAEHSVVQFGATKTRHGETPSPTILKLDGAMCRMVDASQHFMIDSMSNRLQPRSDTSRLYDGGAHSAADVNSRG